MHSNGTTLFETIFTILPVYLYTSIAVMFISMVNSYIIVNKIAHFVLDFFMVVLPCILSFTVFPPYSKDILLISFVILLTLILLVHRYNVSKIEQKNVSRNTYFITNARATVNLLSVIAILAVDFKIFPRRFAKTQNFGYSLMDTGVGLYIFSNGIVAPETKDRKDSVMQSLKSSIPLLILGIARCIFTKNVDYNVPASEYGIHWNFFITLAVTKVFTSLILNIFDIKYIHINAFLLLASHEIFLQAGLQNFVLRNKKRDSFCAANREGIVSSLGYISLYLFSVYIGYILNNQKKAKSNFETVVGSIKGACLTFALSLVFQYYFGISRKLVNAAYCFWILFIGTLMVGLYFISQIVQEYIFRQRSNYLIVYSPLIFEAVNYNGLLFFLIGNVLTGLINLSLNTLYISNYVSLAIIVMYMFVNCLIVSIFYFKQLKFKL